MQPAYGGFRKPPGISLLECPKQTKDLATKTHIKRKSGVIRGILRRLVCA